MPAEKKPMRYAHPDGYTGVCYCESGRFIVTAGSDGDVRIWESLDDDDPKSINMGEKVYSVALKNGMLVTTVSNNIVQVHSFPEGTPDGILTRFTAEANHVVFNNSGTQVAAGSSDFMVKIIDISDNSQQKTFRGHSGPVLSVAFDPENVFLASSSCDGSVFVWKIADQTRVINWLLLNKHNDVSLTSSICRLDWQPKTGMLLAIPVDQTVKLYERETWQNSFDLSDNSITKPINIVSWSPCGRYLAAGSADGSMVVWNVTTKECVERLQHEKAFKISAMAWHPKGGKIAYTDCEGNLGLLEDILVDSGNKKPTSSAAPSFDELFDEDDNDLLTKDAQDHVNLSQSSPTRQPLMDDDEDDGEYDMKTPRSRSKIHRVIDDNSHDIGSPTQEDQTDDGDQAVSVPTVPEPVRYLGPVPTPQQKPFQPCSTPSHLMHRFMMWNSVGIIRCYNDVQDNAIDVEFHDTSVHHAMHLSNVLNHTMADLSQEAVLLACEKSDELPSTLQCIHFSSTDANKEWMMVMPKGENIQAVCLGKGWAAVSTDAQIIRIFSIGGVQKEIFSLAGPVVSMTGHGQQLLVSHHRGIGFDGDQCLGIQLMEFGKSKPILQGVALPITRKSYLTWQGFSAEGTPAFSDSEGTVQMMNRALGNTWVPVCNIRDHCKGKSDHYWIIGIHENPQQLRCIPCKGSRFPPTLPRPAVAILPFKLPYCQIDSEKGQMEEHFWRSVLFHKHFDYLEASGYEIDEAAKGQALKEQQELLMKMFALSCKLEREFRCEELSAFMTQNVLSLAIKYASRSKRLNLAQRLSYVAQEKAAELMNVQEVEEDLRAGMSAGKIGWNLSRVQSQAQSYPEKEEVEYEENTVDNADGEDGLSTLEVHDARKKLNPFSKDLSSTEKTTPKPMTFATDNYGRGNPFKVMSAATFSTSAGSHARNANILDNMSKVSKKSTGIGNQSTNKPGSLVLKPLAPKRKAKQIQATLFQSTSLKSGSKTVEEKAAKADPVPVVTSDKTKAEKKKPKTGYQLWLEDNRSAILTDNPDLEEQEIIKEGMNRFRVLTSEERMSWTNRAKKDGGSINSGEDAKKRKRSQDPSEDQQENEQETKKENSEESFAKKQKPPQVSTNSKLSAFAFQKD
ncbi:WD repeat and HMG-box DNA-binding protein 1 [Callorhinchus milii]|uniref:WD repeat and HMG-box DNA-binding protein 1 n=1 Tax=Callorhinchus milii TaxID=7868 RepID=UPI001C3FA517|nr:WD repeat and HMG-box DNA-binding protein 1 [Callorhinchus milii]XP_007886322.2 WD repeat and HMG-box DNA-binding protein 1 [Callorhinchus milii]